MESASTWFGRDGGLTFTQMGLRAIVVFVVALAILRLGGRRFLGRYSAFDWVLGIILGSVLSRAISGTAPFLPTLGVSALLVMLHWSIGAVAMRWHGLGDVIHGTPVTLVEGGELREPEMRRSHLTREDLLEELRAQIHSEDLEDVERAVLERNGRISVIEKKGRQRNAAGERALPYGTARRAPMP
jgi:uncharacterized membrane protein YcaP (DUF421 family)